MKLVMPKKDFRLPHHVTLYILRLMNNIWTFRESDSEEPFKFDDENTCGHISNKKTIDCFCETQSKINDIIT